MASSSLGRDFVSPSVRHPRAPRRRSFLATTVGARGSLSRKIFGALVVLAVSASGCTEECTEVDCTDSITVSFSKAIPRDYTVEIEFNGTPGTADCSEKTNPGGEDVEVPVVGLDRTILCTQTGALLQGAPADVRFVFTFPDKTVADVTLKPKYQTVQPNGPECEPTCDQAEVTVPL